MAAKLTILYMNEHLDIELYLDGSFAITNRDMEQEQMLRFMTGQRTPATVAWDALEGNLLESIIAFAYDYNAVRESFGIQFTIGFMLDCLEHVADAFPVLTNPVLDFVRVARDLNNKFRHGVQARVPLGDVTPIDSKEVSTAAEAAAYETIQRVVDNIYWAIASETLRDVMAMVKLQHVLNYTSVVRAYASGAKRHTAQCLVVQNVEHDWQARRLIHLIEAKQQKYPRPTVEETP